MGDTPIGDAIEATLVRLAQADDSRAFDELIRRRQGRTRALLRRLSADTSLGDDLAQETFVQAWRHLGRLRDPAGFGAWLRRIAINVWLQYARRIRLDVDAQQDVEAVRAPDVFHDHRLDVEAALAALRPIERLCVLLALSEGMTHAEIVATTSLPLGTVKSHIARGTTRLRRYLAPDMEKRR